MTREKSIQDLKSLIVCMKCKDSAACWAAVNKGELLKHLEDILKILEYDEPKTGQWIHHKSNGLEYMECPRCRAWFLRFHLLRNSFCPNCGLKMEGAYMEGAYEER